jgi:hypothetical protein
MPRPSHSSSSIITIIIILKDTQLGVAVIEGGRKGGSVFPGFCGDLALT